MKQKYGLRYAVKISHSSEMKGQLCLAFDFVFLFVCFFLLTEPMFTNITPFRFMLAQPVDYLLTVDSAETVQTELYTLCSIEPLAWLLWFNMHLQQKLWYCYLLTRIFFPLHAAIIGPVTHLDDFGAIAFFLLVI